MGISITLYMMNRPPSSTPEPNPDGDKDAAPELKVGSLRFEDAIERIESLIEAIESGQIGLEESLHSYEHGMKLICHCRTILDAAEKRVAQWTVSADGQLQAPKEDPEEND